MRPSRIIHLVVLTLLGACDSGTRKEPAPIIDRPWHPVPNRKLDLLFMVDNSRSMLPLQQKLVAQFPALADALRDPASHQLPDLHVAVISSSFGGGAWGNVNTCGSGTHPGDDQGKFQQGPGGAGSGTCGMLHAGATFLETGDGTFATDANYDGDLHDALTCMASLGDDGCGFGSPFESTYYALAKASMAADPDNRGFLRADALLAIVMLTNRDDCSVADNSLLLDPEINSAKDPTGLGALTSYRCNEFGHLCNGAPPPHGYDFATGLFALPAEGVTLDHCVSAEYLGKSDPELRDPNGQPDPTAGHLWPSVEDFTRFIKEFKANPEDIIVAAVAGPTVDENGASLYRVVPQPNPFAGNETDPAIAHACVQSTGAFGLPEYADPAIRVKQWVDSFGVNGVFYPICAGDFGAALTGIASKIRLKMTLVL